MEFYIQFNRDELFLLGNVLSKQYTINMNTLKKYNPHAIDDFNAIAKETEQLVCLMKRIENYGHSFPKK